MANSFHPPSLLPSGEYLTSRGNGICEGSAVGRGWFLAVSGSVVDRSQLKVRNFVENLCNKLRTSANGIRKYLTFVKIEVFPFIVMNCSREMQRWLLYACLEMMPFGLLKCTVRIGYSCKTAVEKFRLELHAAFENRCSFLSEQIKKGVSTSSSAFNSSSMYDTSYSSGINFHVLFPQRLDMSTHLSTYPTDNNTESRPVDHIIFFYKALKKDIEQAVSISANLAIFELYYSGSSQDRSVAFVYRTFVTQGARKDHRMHAWKNTSRNITRMIPWIMASLTVEEQSSLISLWRKATKNTMFDQCNQMMHCETTNDDEKEKKSNNDKVNEPEDSCKVCSAFENSNMDSVLALSQEEFEAIILRVNGDDDLEPQQKSILFRT
ncbi:hypothetical protein Tco_0839122 [Tanacetum coccineum]|uniref:Uncharacterized protein n=1 Tax=Tanacetum coccineum TaxID=301880 RepID=A0ABQ5APS2_9ASTR